MRAVILVASLVLALGVPDVRGSSVRVQERVEPPQDRPIEDPPAEVDSPVVDPPAQDPPEPPPREEPPSDEVPPPNEEPPATEPPPAGEEPPSGEESPGHEPPPPVDPRFDLVPIMGDNLMPRLATDDFWTHSWWAQWAAQYPQYYAQYFGNYSGIARRFSETLIELAPSGTGWVVIGDQRLMWGVPHTIYAIMDGAREWQAADGNEVQVYCIGAQNRDQHCPQNAEGTFALTHIYGNETLFQRYGHQSYYTPHIIDPIVGRDPGHDLWSYDLREPADPDVLAAYIDTFVRQRPTPIATIFNVATWDEVQNLYRPIVDPLHCEPESDAVAQEAERLYNQTVQMWQTVMEQYPQYASYYEQVLAALSPNSFRTQAQYTALGELSGLQTAKQQHKRQNRFPVFELIPLE